RASSGTGACESNASKRSLPDTGNTRPGTYSSPSGRSGNSSTDSRPIIAVRRDQLRRSAGHRDLGLVELPEGCWPGTTRMADGSAGDADYGTIGIAYTDYRQPDPRIGAQINRVLGDARTVLNVGAGAGSYEPTDRQVTAVEPSESMRAQRPAHLVAAI